MKKLLLIHRLWGLSMGLVASLVGVDRPLWFQIVIIVLFLYFMIFGDTHFRKDVK